MKKTEILNSYINRCDDVLKNKDLNAAKELFLEIRSIYMSEIPGFMSGLNCQSAFTWGTVSQYNNWLNDISRVKGKLLNYAATIESKEIQSANLSKSKPINVYNSAIAVANNNIDIDIIIQETKNNIAEATSLSEDETKVALEKIDELLSIAKSKDTKKSKWSKIASIFKWIADKSVDLAISFAPTLLKVLECLQ